MDKKLLIASLHDNEAITKCVLGNPALFSESVDVVFIEHLLTEVNIYDELCDHDSTIRWYKENELFASNKTHHLLNRVSFIPSVLFENFNEQDRDYAKREFEAYLGYSFNSFYGMGNKTPNGICEQLLSLPQQWKQAVIHGIQTPEYYWGLQSQNPLSGHLVYSNIYDYLSWKPNELQLSSNHIFCFKRPAGVPVFVACIGRQCFAGEKAGLSKALEEQLINLSLKITRRLNYFISELLFFVDENKITFACINTEILGAASLNGFDAFVCDNLLKEFESCLN